LKDKVLSHVLS